MTLYSKQDTEKLINKPNKALTNVSVFICGFNYFDFAEWRRGCVPTYTDIANGDADTINNPTPNDNARQLQSARPSRRQL